MMDEASGVATRTIYRRQRDESGNLRPADSVGVWPCDVDDSKLIGGELVKQSDPTLPVNQNPVRILSLHLSSQSIDDGNFAAVVLATLREYAYRIDTRELGIAAVEKFKIGQVDVAATAITLDSLGGQKRG